MRCAEVPTLTNGTYLMNQPQTLLAEYDRWMSAWAADKTRTARVRIATRITERWPDLTKVTTTDLTDWLAERDLARWSRATYHGAARAFFRWLHQSGVLVADPTDSDLFRRPKVSQGVPKPLSRAEEARAMAAASGNTRAWLLLALRAGLRAHEIAKVRGEDVAEDFLSVTGKGAKEAAIPTHPDLWALAQDYPRRGWWFPSPQHEGHVSGASVTILVGRLFRSAAVDIPKGSIHRARHSYATSLLRRGANLRQVQTLMRHDSPATTAIYTAVDEDELRCAINLLGNAS